MENAEILAEITALKSENKSLKSQLLQAEARLALLTKKTFHTKSEKHNEWPELPFEFNEAEVIADSAQNEAPEETTIPEHTRKKRKSRSETLTPDHLPRVDVHHHPESSDCPCCQAPMKEAKPEIQEQLASLPSKFYVVRNHYHKLTCGCKEQAPVTAERPPRLLPKSSIHAIAVATWIEQKYDYALPLYRIERMAKASDVGLTRSVIADAIIKTSQNMLQPLVNMFSERILAHDMLWIDETRLQVLREPDRAAEQKSCFWIRRGGPPGQEAIVLDYEMHANHEACRRLVPEYEGFLISDAFSGYIALGKKNHITNVLCSDHARRKFKEAFNTLEKVSRKQSVANEALRRYAQLYKLEEDYKSATPSQRLEMRKTKAKPLWDDFIAWAEKMQYEGVAHPGTVKALNYFLKYKDGLRTYLSDGRLPISNILAEHVAKHVAVSRKNFLFSSTQSGATASANCFSIVQTAKLHGHNVHKYLAVILTELPAAQTSEQIEACLPWNLSTKEVTRRYKLLPIL